MRDRNQPRGLKLLRWIVRIDVLAMLGTITLWIMIATRSALYVGDSLLLLIPLIFICFTILMYLALESSRIWSVVRASVLGLTNAWLFWTYPLYVPGIGMTGAGPGG